MFLLQQQLRRQVIWSAKDSLVVCHITSNTTNALWCSIRSPYWTRRLTQHHTHTHAHIQTDKYTNICFRCYVTHNSEIFHYKHDNIVIKHLHSLHVISMHYTAV